MSKLTAKELNKVIVNMRAVVRGAVVRIVRKLVAQIRRVKEAKSETKKRRLGRYEKELAAVNKLKRDDVTKFALVNIKTSPSEFKYTVPAGSVLHHPFFKHLHTDSFIQNDTPVEEIVLYKVATEKSMLEAVDKIRESYPNWHQEIPFYLQRFGMRSQIRGESSRVKGKMNRPKQTRTARPLKAIGAKSQSVVVDEKSTKATTTSDEKRASRKSNEAAQVSNGDYPLHPSWQIKRQQAEKERLLRERAKTSCSRRKFDDDE